MIREWISKSQLPFVEELRRSIKVIEIEERMDLLIHRPIGLLLCRLAIRLHLTPTQISFMSLFCGVVAGFFFYQQDQISFAIWGCVFLIMAGILDTVDGQVARLTNQCSELGMMIDGLIDNGVFVAVYLGSALYFYPDYGLWIFVLGYISGYLHSIQSMIFDYYKHEFAFLYSGQRSYRNPDMEEVQLQKDQAIKMIDKVILYFQCKYIKNQLRVVTRKGEIKKEFEALSQSPVHQQEFRKAFKKTYEPFMVQWAIWGGLNSHRTLIMIFCLYGHFDYFLYFNILMTLPTIYVTLLQKKADEEFLKKFKQTAPAESSPFFGTIPQ